MPNIYVRSTDGSDSDNGSTWALAKATLTGAAAIDAAGDTIYVSQAHAESTGSAVTINLAGTPASPVRLICGNDGAEPSTALATTATVTTTVGNLVVNGAAYVYGIRFTSAAVAAMNQAGNAHQTYESCAFRTTNVGSAGGIGFGGAANNSFSTLVKNCTFKFNAVSQGIGVQSIAVFEGGSIESGGTTPTSLFGGAGDRTHSTIVVDGFDFSNLSSGFNLYKPNVPGGATAVFRNCKLPASWSGALITSITVMGQRAEMYNCDSTDTNYRLWVEDYAGSIKSETVVIRTGGANDGTTGLSWKMVTSANSTHPVGVLRSPEVVQWNETTGSGLTATIEIVHDSQGAGSGSKFQDDEIWLEVMYLGTSGVPLGTWITDCKADVLAAAANQTDSSETWTTTGLTTPVKQKLSVTFTAQEKGFIHARVVMAKASKTAYICPKLAVA
jgi:hypothetical protein